MATITITKLSFSEPPLVNQEVVIMVRKTSDPDVFASYINLGKANVKPNGDLIIPKIASGLVDNTQYTVWATNQCSNSSLTTSITTLIGCGVPTQFSGGESFPTQHTHALGNILGNVVLDRGAGMIPDRWTVEYPVGSGIIVIDTGYVGDSSFQSVLDSALAARGLPPSTIAGPGGGSETFNKTDISPNATVRVYAPLPATGWKYTLSCPGAGLFSSVMKNGFFQKQCPVGQTGTIVEYISPAGAHLSVISQADADNLAQADVDDVGQSYANLHGTCF